MTLLLISFLFSLSYIEQALPYGPFPALPYRTADNYEK